jgi:hypothetical protein
MTKSIGSNSSKEDPAVATWFAVLKVLAFVSFFVNLFVLPPWLVKDQFLRKFHF